MHIHKTAFIEILRVNHRAVDIGKNLELRRAPDVISVTAGAVAHDFFARRIMANLAWLEGFDHAVLFGHAPNPFV